MARLFYCDHHSIPLPPGHKFPAEKYAILRALLAADGHYSFEPAPFADPAALGRVHDPAYVAAFLDGSIDPRLMRQIGFPWSEALVRRTLASVGGTLSAAEDALATGFGGNLAGGTHHAFRDAGAGFCVFNDLAIAIRAMGRRAAVLDLDVHQGDGTAAIFAGDDSVFTVSIHGAQNFPFRKQLSRLDVALPDGTADDEYLDHLRAALPQVAGFRPDVLLYQSGVDALAGDRLGRLALTHAGLAERDRIVFQFARHAGLPIVVTLGGGYANPISRTAEAHANTFRAAAAILRT
ncbi:MAG TPA: histone deacetylase [Verrucomicrobiae bacterium]|nr:histone deacetylase [Verrucomicrobiae bacterium]